MDCSTLSRDRLLDLWLGRQAPGDPMAAHLQECAACRARLEQVANACDRLRMSPSGPPEVVHAGLLDALEELALERAARRAPMESLSLLRGEWLLGLVFALLLIVLGFLVWPWSREAERASERVRPDPPIRTPTQLPSNATIKERSRPEAPELAGPQGPGSQGR